MSSSMSDGKRIVNEIGAMGSDAATLAGAIAAETYSSSVTAINMGFTLSAALAWSQAVKALIERFIKSNSGIVKMHLTYAVAVTLLSAVVFVLTKRFLKPSLTKANVAPVMLR